MGSGTHSSHSWIWQKQKKGWRKKEKIENPIKKMVGVQQIVKLKSNTVYRLSASARSVATNNPKIIFGGRLALWQRGQKEKQIVWMSEYNHCWKKISSSPIRFPVLQHFMSTWVMGELLLPANSQTSAWNLFNKKNGGQALTLFTPEMREMPCQAQPLCPLLKMI